MQIVRRRDATFLSTISATMLMNDDPSQFRNAFRNPQKVIGLNRQFALFRRRFIVRFEMPRPQIVRVCGGKFREILFDGQHRRLNP